MRVLAAEDDAPARRLLAFLLKDWGYDAVAVDNGDEAWCLLSGDAPPALAVLDRAMPGMDGLDLCRRLVALAPTRRRASDPRPPYVILLTGKGAREEIVEGLEAGADDYVVKPFERDELQLEEARTEVSQLRGLLPICAWCKRVRETESYWQQIEVYVRERSGADFTHTICPECRGKIGALAADRRRPKDQAG